MLKIFSVLLLIQSLAFSNTCQDIWEFNGFYSNNEFVGVGVTDVDSIYESVYTIDSLTSEKTFLRITETSYFNGEVIERDSANNGDTTKLIANYSSDGITTTYLFSNDTYEGQDTTRVFTNNGLLDSITRNGFSPIANSIDRAYRSNDSLTVISYEGSSLDTIASYFFKNDTTFENNGSFDNLYVAKDSTCSRLESVIANLSLEFTKTNWGWYIIRESGDKFWEWKYINKQKYLSPIVKVNIVKNGNTFIHPNGVVIECNTKEECSKLKKSHLGVVW